VPDILGSLAGGVKYPAEGALEDGRIQFSWMGGRKNCMGVPNFLWHQSGQFFIYFLGRTFVL